MKSTCVIIAVLILIFALPFVANYVGDSVYREKINSLIEMDYEIQPLDSLWGIANRFCPDYINTGDYVNLLIEKNNLYNTLQPGQKIKVYCD